MRGEARAPRRRRRRADDEPPPPRGWPDGFGSGERERRALLVLASLRGLLPGDLHALAWDTGSAEGCVAAIRSGRGGSRNDRTAAGELDPSVVATAVIACGARFAPPDSEEYLPGLLDLEDPPIGLFVRGRAVTELWPRVAVVGARNCSPTGREIAFDVGEGLGAAGVCVVSGAARGVDSVSHEGALAAGGATVAVLGCGVDIFYPPGSRRLIGRIVDRGAVVSEYPPGVPPEPHRFPARNRIIAALVDAVVIVEGGEHSGSLITADHALDLGRQVFALAGAVTNPLAAAPLALIRDGAALIRGAEDLLADLGLPDRRTRAEPARLSQLERAVIEALTGPLLPEAVAAALRVPLPTVLSALVELEMRGLVRSAGGRFDQRPAAGKVRE